MTDAYKDTYGIFTEDGLDQIVYDKESLAREKRDLREMGCKVTVLVHSDFESPDFTPLFSDAETFFGVVESIMRQDMVTPKTAAKRAIDKALTLLESD